MSSARGPHRSWCVFLVVLGEMKPRWERYLEAAATSGLDKMRSRWRLESHLSHNWHVVCDTTRLTDHWLSFTVYKPRKCHLTMIGTKLMKRRMRNCRMLQWVSDYSKLDAVWRCKPDVRGQTRCYLVLHRLFWIHVEIVWWFKVRRSSNMPPLHCTWSRDANSKEENHRWTKWFFWNFTF